MVISSYWENPLGVINKLLSSLEVVDFPFHIRSSRFVIKRTYGGYSGEVS